MNRATALRELRKCLKNNENPVTAFAKFSDHLNFFELDLITDQELRYSIIMHYAVNNDKTLLRFVSGLTNEQVDFNRHLSYKEFRLKNATDSWSEEFFKLKFGKDWQEHYQAARSTRHNAYDAVSVAKKYGCSISEAKEKVFELKNKTKPTIEKFIEKYGKVDGKKKFYEVCRYHKNYIDYWKKLHPNDAQLAEQKFKEYTTSISLKHINFYLKRGYTKAEAIELISEHQKSAAGVHRKYYENLGIPSTDIDSILLEINKRKDSASLRYVESRNPGATTSEILSKYKSHNFSKSSTYRANGFLRKDDPEIDNRMAYYAAVDYYTKFYSKAMPPCPGKRGKKAGNYHVDHKFSKHEGLNNNVPPNIIGHVVNLQWLLVEENCSKRAQCHITKEELLLEYKNYENQID